MNELLNLILKNWFGVFVGIIGVVGSIASIVSWRNAKRSRRLYDHLFHAAETVIQREAQNDLITKEIEEKKRQASAYESTVKHYTEKIIELQEQIRLDIPKAARRAVLRDRLDSSLSLMKMYYDDVVNIDAQIQNLGEATPISKELLMRVRSQIQPRYVIRERISNLKIILTLITSASAIASTLLPYPFSRFVGSVLLLLAIPVLFFIIKATLEIRARTRHRGKHEAVLENHIKPEDK